MGEVPHKGLLFSPLWEQGFSSWSLAKTKVGTESAPTGLPLDIWSETRHYRIAGYSSLLTFWIKICASVLDVNTLTSRSTQVPFPWLCATKQWSLCISCSTSSISASCVSLHPPEKMNITGQWLKRHEITTGECYWFSPDTLVSVREIVWIQFLLFAPVACIFCCSEPHRSWREDWS